MLPILDFGTGFSEQMNNLENLNYGRLKKTEKKKFD